MANDTILTDDYVAELLAKDAAERSVKYSTMGLEAYRSVKPGNKAKPNTRFLQNIIKSTKNHNAALLAKEAAESQARLNNLAETQEKKQRRYKPDANDTRKRQLGAISAILTGKRKRDGGEPKYDADGEAQRTEKSGSSHRKSRREKRTRTDDTEGGQDTAEAQSYENQDGGHGEASRRRRRDRSSSPSHHRERDYRNRSPVDRKSRAKSSEASATREHDKEQGRLKRNSPWKKDLMDHLHSNRNEKDKKQPRKEPAAEEQVESRLPSHQRHREHEKRWHKSSPGEASSKQRVSRRSRSGRLAEDGPGGEMSDDSDPLDECIGPAAPVRTRGRGAASGPSAMDSRFSSEYDPKSDVALDPNAADDWDEAIEAYRDRQKWKQQGADRLRTAGFSDEQIKRWETGDEKSEQDVRWTKKGEKREWDRGKTTGSDGAAQVAAEWTK